MAIAIARWIDQAFNGSINLYVKPVTIPIPDTMIKISKATAEIPDALMTYHGQEVLNDVTASILNMLTFYLY